ncbi:MAG: hypothetical protein AB7J13_15785, partial [Pyrinomonadaceae bacterium]
MRKVIVIALTIILCVYLSASPGGRTVRSNAPETMPDVPSQGPLVAKPRSGSKRWMISGTRTIGPTGDYASVGAAIADIQTQGLDGALILELLPTYASGVETFPLNFTNLTGISSTNTLTLRPQVGATNLSISGNNATAIVNLENAQFVTFDGRPGGAGTAKELTIENSSTAGATIRFINEASNNTIRHTAIKGATTAQINGVVFFSTTTGEN